MTGIESCLWGRACLPTSPSTTGIQRMAAILGLAASSFHRLLLSSLSLSVSSRPLFSLCESPGHEWRSSFPLFALNTLLRISLCLSLSLPLSASLAMNVSLHDRREREFPFPLPSAIRVILRSDITTNRYLSSRCLLVSQNRK